MSRDTHTCCQVSWEVTSVCLRARDGRHRIEEVYRLLLGCQERRPARSFRPVARRGRAGEEGDDASRDLRTCFHRPAGTQSDH
jgi:hypothetical protein